MKLSLAKKQLYFTLNTNKKGLNLLNSLEKLNLIRFYEKKSKTIVRVYPSFTKLFKTTRLIRLYLKKKHFISLSFRALKLLNFTTPYSHILLETSKGILTNKEAIYYKIGGTPILFVL